MSAQLAECPSTELATLPPVERAKSILKSADLAPQLVALAKESAHIVAITNADGCKQVHAKRMVLKNERIALEKAGKGAREDATAFSKAVIAEEDRLIGLIKPEETRLETLQGVWDAKIETEKEAERLRQQRIVDDARAVIQWFRDQPTEAVGKTATEIADMLRVVEQAPLADLPEQFLREGEATKILAIAKLGELYSARKRFELEQIELQAERDSLAEQKREQEAERARKDKKAEDARVERDRIDGIKLRIEDITIMQRIAIGRSSEAIAVLMIELEELPADFAEFSGAAVMAQNATMIELRRLHAEAIDRERKDAEFRAQSKADSDRKAQEAANKRAAEEKAEKDAAELARAETQRRIAECTLLEAAVEALAFLDQDYNNTLAQQMLRSAIERDQVQG